MATSFTVFWSLTTDEQNPEFGIFEVTGMNPDPKIFLNKSIHKSISLCKFLLIVRNVFD